MWALTALGLSCALNCLVHLDIKRLLERGGGAEK
jgi:hypothetical protein